VGRTKKKVSPTNFLGIRGVGGVAKENRRGKPGACMYKCAYGGLKGTTKMGNGLVQVQHFPNAHEAVYVWNNTDYNTLVRNE